MHTETLSRYSEISVWPLEQSNVAPAAVSLIGKQ